VIELVAEVDWAALSGCGFWPMLLVAFGAGMVIGILAGKNDRHAHEEASDE
jgi:hypothetical protein